jgi:hypothetical protein
LTLATINQVMSRDVVLPIFIKREWLEFRSNFILMEDFIYNNEHFCLIVDCEGSTTDQMSFFISKLKTFVLDRVILVIDKKSNPKDYAFGIKSIQIEHALSDLTQSSQKVLWAKTVNFQGFNVKLEDLVNSNFSKRQIPLNDLVMRNELHVGKALKIYNPRSYIERKFIYNHKRKRHVISEEDLISFSGPRGWLLSAISGSGSSTTFIAIASKLKAKYPNYWVLLIEPNDLDNILKPNSILPDFTRFNEKILISFIQNIIVKKKKKGFAKSVFSKLFMEGRVIIFMADVHEFCPYYEDFLIAFLKKVLSESKNKLCISCQPSLERKLELALNLSLIRFETLENCDEIANKMTINLGIAGFIKLACVQKVLQPIKSPRFMEYLIESLAKPNDLNLYTIMENIHFLMLMKAQIDGPRSKAFSRVLMASPNQIVSHQMCVVFQKVAFKKNFRRSFQCDESFIKNKVEQVIRLHFDCIPIDDDLRNVLATQIGVLVEEGSGDLDFIQDEFGDFFIAKFIIAKVFLHNVLDEESFKNAVDILEIVVDYSEDYKLILRFLNDGLTQYRIQSSQNVAFTRIFNEKFRTKMLSTPPIFQKFPNLRRAIAMTYQT